MFSELIVRNSKRDRKNNGLYLGSMIISVIAFYIILSLSHQDVMLFLKKMESDAVNRLLAIVPVFYLASLAILFFLVYFASGMQIERRKHELGVCLTLGMRRSKLFLMLLLEDMRNNTITLAAGLPIAIVISELISLITAKAVGLGIIEHKISLSFTAVLFTVIGFLTVKLIALVFLSAKTASREIGELLFCSPSGAKRSLPKAVYLLCAIVGILLLVKAYRCGISGEAWENRTAMAVTLFFGAAGTILLFLGMRLPIGALAKRGSKRSLLTYNFRQVQELIIHRTAVIAICSLLIFAALCLFGAGVAISAGRSDRQTHILDYTFKDRQSGEHLDADKVRVRLAADGLLSEFSRILEIKVGYPAELSTVSFQQVVRELAKEEDSRHKETLLHNLKQNKDCYLISLTGYNELRQAANLKPIQLKNHEAALYMEKEYEPLMNSAIRRRPAVSVMGNNLTVTGKVQSLPVTADREITLSVALVVSDSTFERYTGGEHSTYVSGILAPAAIKEKGLMKAISDTNEKLNRTSLAYESYIQNMGRQLFFIVAASYITIYLAIVFLVVANTILGVQFLMGQRKSHKRYQTLIHLGATYETLCRSSGKQINWYFGLPIAVAFINSFFGVRSLFSGILPPGAGTSAASSLKVAALSIVLLTVVEFVYIRIVKKNSSKYLWTLMEPGREE